MRDVLTIILGGGQGSRLHPLTQTRSKPAVPIGGKYRLIDVPISNCLHVDLRRIFVLTQFNSASLNRHVAQAYRLDLFSKGFVEVLAAEQTPENKNWFQGTADAVRQAMRHFVSYDADYYLILAGDHLFRMDFSDLIEAHVASRADVTIAAQPVNAADATQMGILKFDTSGQIVGFEEKPSAERLQQIGASVPPGAPMFSADDEDTPFVASMGIYVFSRQVLIDVLEQHAYIDFGREVIPASLGTHRVRPYLFRGYWADVGTIESFYDANVSLTRPGAPFSFYDPHRPIYTNSRFLPPSRFYGCDIRESLVAEGCFMDDCHVTQSVVGIRQRIDRGATVTRSVLLGADFYDAEDDAPQRGNRPLLGIGHDVVIDGAIVDKNVRIGDGARLVNERHVQEADGDGWCIRSGIIVVPKGATIAPGTVV